MKGGKKRERECVGDVECGVKLEEKNQITKRRDRVSHKFVTHIDIDAQRVERIGRKCKSRFEKPEKHGVFLLQSHNRTRTALKRHLEDTWASMKERKSVSRIFTVD